MVIKIKLPMLIFLMSFSAFSAQKTTKTLTFNGTLDRQVELYSEKVRTESETYTYTGTCYEQVYEGTDTVCSKSLSLQIQKRRVCSMNNGRRVCSGSSSSGGSSSGGASSGSSYTRTCRTVPVYSTSSYSCEKFGVRTYTVKEYSTSAKVFVEFGNLPPGMEDHTPKVTFHLSSEGKLKVYSKDGDGLLVLAKVVDGQRSGDSPSFFLESTVRVRFVNKESVYRPLTKGIKEKKLNGEKLEFVIGKVAHEKALHIELKAWRVRWFFLKDKLRFNGTLPKDSYELIDQGNRTKVVVNLGKLFKYGKKDRKYRFKVTLNILKHPELVTLPMDLPKSKIKRRFRRKIK